MAAVPGKYISVLETPHANWFLLDSLEKPSAKHDSAGKDKADLFNVRFQGINSGRWCPGSLGKAQLAWLGKALDARPTSRPSCWTTITSAWAAG